MKRNFTRNKEGIDFGNLGPAESTFIQVIDEVITEMNWGGNFEFTEDNVKITTKCFGCIDTTVFIGTKEEIVFIKELVASKSNVLSFLTSKMNIAPKKSNFKMDEIMSALDLFFQGASSNDIEELLNIDYVPEPVIKPDLLKVVDLHKDLKTNPLLNALDVNDGAHKVALGFIASQLSI